MKRAAGPFVLVLFAVAFVLASAFAAACSKSSAPELAPADTSASKVEAAAAPPAASPSAAAAATPSTTPGTTATTAAAATPGPDDVGYDAPASWTSAPNPSPMRKATYKIPKAPGDAEDAELTVSSAGGGVDANVKRWAGQFGVADPKKDKRKVNGLDVTLVEMKGTFAGGGMMGPSTPKEHQMLLGAIVDGGERQHFFKLVGPEKTVTAARKDFEKLVASLRAK